jgi:hypothetical protein
MHIYLVQAKSQMAIASAPAEQAKGMATRHRVPRLQATFDLQCDPTQVHAALHAISRCDHSPWICALHRSHPEWK